jgi:ABC-type multidrug transport system ATPase subunit
MSAADPMIRLERFEKRFGRIEAVKPLDLEIARGEAVALLGPNGSGKSTIISALVGLHRPSGGRIVIDGFDIVKAPDEVKRRLAYVPQRVGLPEMLTAGEVVSLFGRLRGVSQTRVDEVLELFALGSVADRYTRELSGGMLQRIGLATAFLQEVPLFVLDEPTANLDLLGVDRLRQLLGELKDKGATVVMSSHILQSAMQFADRVAVLVDGKLVQLEEAPVFQAAVAREMTVRVVVDRTSPAIVEAIREAGAAAATHNGRQVTFQALPTNRLNVIRAIERAGGSVEEVHTEAPDWESLLRHHFDAGGHAS